MINFCIQKQAIQQKLAPLAKQQQQQKLLSSSGDAPVASRTYVLGGESGAGALGGAPTNYLGIRDDDMEDEVENMPLKGAQKHSEDQVRR